MTKIGPGPVGAQDLRGQWDPMYVVRHVIIKYRCPHDVEGNLSYE